MRINVLGPLTAEVQGRSFVPSAGKPRQLLALLAVCANQVLPVPTLMEEIWGYDLPRSAVTTLQTYILQLRRRLATAYGKTTPKSAKEVLVTRYGGYLLQAPRESVDLYEYEGLAAAGREAFDKGEYWAASAILGSALGLWRGPALVDVPIGPVLKIEVDRLEESRLSALERRVEADLRLGRHTALLAELAELTARHPLHEGLHSQRMKALYRSGRASHALQVYQTLRKRLVADLGMEPSHQLQELHHAVLANDPSLDLRDTTAQQQATTITTATSTTATGTTATGTTATS